MPYRMLKKSGRLEPFFTVLKMRSILYLHGFCASSQSWKAQILKKYLAERGLSRLFLCPDLSHQPKTALLQVWECIEKNPHVALMGSSLGGHYASVAAEKFNLPAVLLNPAVVGKIDPSLFLGEHQNFYTLEKFVFTRNDANDLLAQGVRPTPSRYWLLQELGDEVLNPQDAQNWFFGAKTTLLEGGDHSFTRFAEVLPFLLEWLWAFEE